MFIFNYLHIVAMLTFSSKLWNSQSEVIRGTEFFRNFFKLSFQKTDHQFVRPKNVHAIFGTYSHSFCLFPKTIETAGSWQAVGWEIKRKTFALFFEAKIYVGFGYLMMYFCVLSVLSFVSDSILWNVVPSNLIDYWSNSLSRVLALESSV